MWSWWNKVDKARGGGGGILGNGGVKSGFLTGETGAWQTQWRGGLGRAMRPSVTCLETTRRLFWTLLNATCCGPRMEMVR